METVHQARQKNRPPVFIFFLDPEGTYAPSFVSLPRVDTVPRFPVPLRNGQAPVFPGTGFNIIHASPIPDKLRAITQGNIDLVFYLRRFLLTFRFVVNSRLNIVSIIILIIKPKTGIHSDICAQRLFKNRLP